MNNIIFRMYKLFQHRNLRKDNIAKLKELNAGYETPPFKIDEKNDIVTTRGEIKFDIRLIEPYIMLETFGLRIHDQMKIEGKGKTLVDAGSCFGDTPLYFASKGCKVYALEPNPRNYKAMLKNIDLNQNLKPNIIPINAAIGKDGDVEFTFDDTYIDGGGSAYLQKLGKRVKVKSFSLSGLMNKYGLNEIDYLKMDCKGAGDLLTVTELKAIAECAKIEYTNTDGKRLEELKKKLEAAGFKFKVYRHNPGDTSAISNHGTILATKQ